MSKQQVVPVISGVELAFDVCNYQEIGEVSRNYGPHPVYSI